MAEAHYLVLLSTGSPSFRRQKSWVGIRTQRQPVVKIDHSTSQSLVLSDSGYCGQAPVSVSGTQVPKYLSKVLRSSLNVTDYNWAWYLLGVFARPCLTQVSNSFLNGFFVVNASLAAAAAVNAAAMNAAFWQSLKNPNNESWHRWGPTEMETLIFFLSYIFLNLPFF